MGKSTQVDGDNNPTSPESDPAKLLEAALLQMDGIIAEAGGTGPGGTGPGRAARARALELAQQLALSLQHAIPPPPRPDFTTASAILRWLQQNNNSVALIFKRTMNCLTPRSRTRKHAEEANAPPYYPQPPYNPDFIMEDRAILVLPCGVHYSVRYSVTCYKGEDINGTRGRRSLYEGVNWMPIYFREFGGRIRALLILDENMRELGRGGSLVAATIAALHSRSVVNEKLQPFNSHLAIEEDSNASRTSTVNNIEEFNSKRISEASDRPLSTASEASEHSASVNSSEEPPPQEMSFIGSLMSDQEYLTEPFDEEQERTAVGYVHPAVRSYMYSPMGDSDSPDETAVKCTAWTNRTGIPARADSLDSDSSTTEDDSDEHAYETGVTNADYRTLTPNRRDDTTRCDNDFKWMPTCEIMDDNEDSPLANIRMEAYSAASLDRRRRTSGNRSDRDRKTRSSLSTKPPQHPSSGRASSRPRHPNRNQDTPPDGQRRWNSYEHFRWPEGGWWPPMCWCHAPVPPPCYMQERTWPSHPSLAVPLRTNKNDAEDRVRRLEADKESLQLQVQVLSEQISAQSEKMAELERSLHDARQRLDDTEQKLQKEMLQRSSLETQKLELLSKLSEVRLRVAERGLVERSPPPESTPVARPAPPRTPPANYGRQIERNTHVYSSLPRGAGAGAAADARVAFGKHSVVDTTRGRGHSVPNLAEKEEAIPRSSPSPSLREVRARLGSGVRLEGDDLARSSLRASLPRQRLQTMPWQTTDIRQWDCETTCGWLESLGLETYVASARAWLSASDARGLIASTSHNTIEKELGLKHPMHKKKIVLAITDLLGGHGDPLLTLAGQLDSAWALRWLEDVGVCGARAAAADAALDARALHRLTHAELHAHLRVTHALHALSIRRGIQVLRENNFNPETMIRRAPSSEVVGVGVGVDNEAADGGGGTPDLARWSSHRVMQWLKEIDLAEYAPNLRGAGVHGGLMLLEPRFTAELLAALLNIPANKTLLRRHLTQRFNDLLGREVIQQKRNAEQTLGYQPLTATTKYKVPKKSQFSLKRKKSKDELDLGDLLCPLHDSGDAPTSPMMKAKSATAGVASAVCPPRDDARAH